MPIPKPNAGESEADFIRRCMADPAIVSEFADGAQRAAVCHSAWREAREEALSEIRDGLVRIPIAYTGEFQQGDKQFTISASDLRDMQRNMSRRETPLDYEHLSAAAGVAPTFTRAAGWLKPLAGEIEAFGEGREILWGWAEFTPACLASIRQKEFRYLSPEIHWKSKDEAGRQVGTRLAAAAITNRPFLKDLPPIEISAVHYPALLERVALAESIRLLDPQSVHVPADPANRQPEVPTLKNFTLRKMTEGEHVGKFGVYEGATLVGLCDMPAEEPTPAMRMAEAQRADAVCLAEFAKVSSAELLTKAEEFVGQNKLTMAGFLRAQRIERLLSEAIAAGRILPKQRETIFNLAIADYVHTAAYLSELKPVVDLRTRGLAGGDSGLTAREEMEARVKAWMTEHKETRYADALRAVTSADPDFYERYKAECSVTAGDPANR